MRNIGIVLLLLCGFYHASQRHSVEPADLDVGSLARLGRRVQSEPTAQPDPVTVVHCVVNEVGSFLRRSDCLERGGVIDEPHWARSED